MLISYTDESRRQYEDDLLKRQEEHLQEVQRHLTRNWQPCLHDGCSECYGTGVRKRGGPCVHMISCPCPRCTSFCM